MPAQRLTKELLSLRPTSGLVRLWDSQVPGLAAWLRPNAATFYYQRDVRGKTRRILIGRWPTVPLAKAREVALRLASQMQRGRAKHHLDAPTLDAAYELYLETVRASAAHVAFVKRAIEVRLGDWRKLPLDEITPRMVKARHRELSAEGLVMADETFRAMRAVWNAAADEWSVPRCPVPKWNNPTPKRNQPIRDLAAWHKAVLAIDNPIHRDFYIFLLLTGCRRSEVAALTWEQVNREDRYIHLPKTKSGRAHFLPINDHHLEVIDRQPRQGRFVFPDRSGKKALVSPRHLEVPGTLHGLRHTWASVAAEIGFDEATIGRVLNHAHGGNGPTITSRYIHVQLASLRPIMDAVTEELTTRLNGSNTEASSTLNS